MQCVRVYGVQCSMLNSVFAFSQFPVSVSYLPFFAPSAILRTTSMLEGFSKDLGLHRERVNGAPHGCLIHATSDVGCAVESGAGHGVEYRLFAHIVVCSSIAVVLKYVFGALSST